MPHYNLITNENLEGEYYYYTATHMHAWVYGSMTLDIFEWK
jgi:hypothetical protein